MTGILLDLPDGRAHPIALCEWVFYGACGCPIACSTAVRTGVLLRDEQAALGHVFGNGTKTGNRAALERELAAGTTAVLMTREEFMRLDPHLPAICPHRRSAGPAPVERTTSDQGEHDSDCVACQLVRDIAAADKLAR